MRNDPPLLIIAQTSPLAISGALAAILTGRVINRIGPGWAMFLSMCAFLTGNTLIATAPIHQTY